MNPQIRGPEHPPGDGLAPWACRVAAGLDTGLAGAVAFCVWLVVGSLAGGGFWFSRLNLAAAPMYGDLVFSSGAGWHTLAGGAVYLLIYSLLGVVYACLPASREGWLNLLTALGYAGLMHLCADAWLWKRFHPFAPPYFAPLAIAPGHLLYGVALWRYPARLRSLTLLLGNARAVALLAPEPAAELAEPGKDQDLHTGTPDRGVEGNAQGPVHEPHCSDGSPPPSSLE